MQSASMTLVPVPASNASQCQIVLSENNYTEVNPVNLAAYADRIHQSNADVLRYPSRAASCSGYSQNVDGSPTKFNCPIDLAVSTPRDGSHRANLNIGSPVNLAAYTRKELDCSLVLSSNLSVNQTKAPVRSCDVGDRPPQSISTDIKDQGTSSSALAQQPQTYQDNFALIHTLASAVSSQQTAATYQHGLGMTPSLPSLSSYQSATWRPLLSPHTTAQLVASAVNSGISRQAESTSTPHANDTAKEREHDPLLLQLQTAQLQALLRGLPPTSSVQHQSSSASSLLSTQRRQFACNICGKMLSSQHNLRLHEATIHRGLFQFHCPICNKGLRQERDLRGHLANRHDWKKEFRCSICGHEFGYKRNLKHHVMSHHGRSSLNE